MTVGELEFWITDLMKDGPSKDKKAIWAHEAAKKLKEADAQEKDIWSFTDKVVKYLSENLNKFSNEKARSFDRDTLIFPEVIINHFDEDLPEAFKPLFNVMWQSAGWEKSKKYDDNGKWLGGNFLNDF